ncbi:hypothetical protein FZC78_17445 [Rossellomorea vietnamensis]|uniref:Uncharacterized protein n=1 Tax=Rossellomorea vietnamensis TaxID=218284 RepID=A0A5D4NMT3_9BACI|nr:hypothetical protein FZC78_17445 [Rossellomorea vietnamensis]
MNSDSRIREVVQLKQNGNFKDVIYVHQNEALQYVMSYGLEFRDFSQNLPNPLNHLLMIKHQFDHGSFNMNTMMEYTNKKEVSKLAGDNIYSYGDFCWIDFEEVDGLDQLSGQELAEILYLGHTKQSLNSPFYSKLNNRFVYLAHDDGWFNKVYYRYTNDFYQMLGNSIPGKLLHQKGEKSLKRLLPSQKITGLPPIPTEVIYTIKEKIKEGVAISLEKTVKGRASLKIPMWVMGDYMHMDSMYEDYQVRSAKQPYAYFVFDKKAKEWSLHIN